MVVTKHLGKLLGSEARSTRADDVNVLGGFQRASLAWVDQRQDLDKLLLFLKASHLRLERRVEGGD